MQLLITSKLKKWLGIPKSLAPECIYARTFKLQLPYSSSLIEEFTATKARNLATFQESSDKCVQNANIKVDADTKMDIEK